MAAKRTVAIFANYEATEKTLCALYLAAHITRRYRYAAWIVPQHLAPASRYRGFSHQWDTEIMPLDTQTNEIKARLEKCEICFFFEESEPLFSLLPSTAKTAVFLDPHEWNHETSRFFAKKCTHSLSVSSYITKKIASPNLLANELLCPFDPMVQCPQKPGIWSGETATILYNAYGMSFLERQCLRRVSEIVKKCCPQSKSAICYYDANATPEPGIDPRAYDWKLFSYLKQSDWIIDLTPKPLLGFFAAFAGTLGTQWSCFNLPPNTDEYNSARRHLIPYPEGGLAKENAEVIAGHIVRQLTTPFRDDLDRDNGAGGYVRRTTRFIRSINQMLGVKGSKKEA